MRYAILTFHSCCDYHDIGGAESLVRRISRELCARRHDVDYVIYGQEQKMYEERFWGSLLRVFYLHNFADALQHLGSHAYDHVMMVYIRPQDRLAYWRFQSHNLRTKFHYISLGEPGHLFRWPPFLIAARLLTQRGSVFSICPKSCRVLDIVGVRAKKIVPPVPSEWFVAPERRERNGLLRLSYFGRMDKGKGFCELEDLFAKLNCLHGIRTLIHGYTIGNRTGWDTDNDLQMGVERKAVSCKYSPEGDEQMREHLGMTDILILPYRTLRGTINPPLLLLEGMAAGCAVITRPVGNIQQIYGTSPFVISGSNFVSDAITLIKRILRTPEILETERERVRQRVVKLRCETRDVVDIMLRDMNEEECAIRPNKK